MCWVRCEAPAVHVAIVLCSLVRSFTTLATTFVCCKTVSDKTELWQPNCKHQKHLSSARLARMSSSRMGFVTQDTFLSTRDQLCLVPHIELQERLVNDAQRWEHIQNTKNCRRHLSTARSLHSYPAGRVSGPHVTTPCKTTRFHLFHHCGHISCCQSTVLLTRAHGLVVMGLRRVVAKAQVAHANDTFA